MSKLLTSLLEERELSRKQMEENKLLDFKELLENIWPNAIIEIMNYKTNENDVYMFNITFDDKIYYVSFCKYKKIIFMQNFTVTSHIDMVSLNISNNNGFEYDNKNICDNDCKQTDDVYCNIIKDNLIPYLQQYDFYFI